MRDNRITKASEAFIITVEFFERKLSQRRKEVYFTFKSVSVFELYKSFNILAIVIATIMADKINIKNIAEDFSEVSLKTPSDF